MTIQRFAYPYNPMPGWHDSEEMRMRALAREFGLQVTIERTNSEFVVTTTNGESPALCRFANSVLSGVTPLPTLVM